MWKKLTPEQWKILQNSKKGDIISLHGIGMIKVVGDTIGDLCNNCIFDRDTRAWTCYRLCTKYSKQAKFKKFILGGR